VENSNQEVLDDLGLNVEFTGRLTITHVHSGSAPSSILSIRYIGHSDLVPDHPVRLHLRRAKDGIWLVCGDRGRGYICR
jgi:hypothetical protein